jgi:nitrile hydratase subunit beta
MNGPHDVGGQMAFGPVAPEPNEPPFHADWEKRALGLVICSGAMGAWTIDESRHARESLPAAVYYASSYYEIWIKGLEILLKRHGFISDRDIEAGKPVDAAPAPKRVLKAEDAAAAMARGGPCNRPVSAAPRFSAGQLVRARNFDPDHHTRLPRYARGKTGVIEAVRNGYVLPDTNAHGRGENPEWVYTVAFDARELWGGEADPTLTVSIDAWENYLEPA